MPEFLANSNLVNFGTKDDKTVVDDVLLPEWADKSPIKFV